MSSLAEACELGFPLVGCAMIRRDRGLRTEPNGLRGGMTFGGVP